MPCLDAIRFMIASVPEPRAWVYIGWPSKSFQVLNFSVLMIGKNANLESWKTILIGALTFWIRA